MHPRLLPKKGGVGPKPATSGLWLRSVIRAGEGEEGGVKGRNRGVGGKGKGEGEIVGVAPGHL